MEAKEMRMDLAGREFKISHSPIATYATGYAVVSLGDTVIMANTLISNSSRDGDFFPMVVDYEENMYAAGKIKGSRFVKRAGRPSENATLISRLIDRPLRPMFPKKTRNEVQIICSALSVDMEVDPATTALNAASVATLLAGAPLESPVGAVRIGYKNGQLIVNPTYEECETGDLNLVVAGTLDAITMVEAAANEVPEEVIIQAFEKAHEEIKKICQFQLEFVRQFEIQPVELVLAEEKQEALEAVKALVTDEMLDNVKGTTKMDVKHLTHEIEDMLMEKLAADLEAEKFSKAEIKDALNTLLEKRMRYNILTKEERIDGRKLDEIRPVTVYRDILPRTHGSAIFQRGETMVLTITTLGSPGAAQLIDDMDRDEVRRYMHHYRFPPYATGEIKPLRGPGRREIGHGDLAERALLPVLPSKEEFPYTMWLVSETIRCNGSSSMASVCGSTLSLMCAGVPIKKPVAGIAMGLVTNPDGGYKILSDIQGMEDFAGDMDFKAAGTADGITALQMDIKIEGLTMDLIRDALTRAKAGREFIMARMLEVVPNTADKLSPHAPMIMSLQIPEEMIRVVIGKGGETIQGLTAEFGVEVDIDDSGLVMVTAPNQEKGNGAIERIKLLTAQPEVGKVYDGTVKRIENFGAFVEIIPGKDGLVHISEFSHKRINRVEDVVKVGDKIQVKLVEIDKQGRLNLSHKVLLPADGHDSGHSHSDHRNNSRPEDRHVAHNDGKGNGEGEIVEGTSAVRKIS